MCQNQFQNQMLVSKKNILIFAILGITLFFVTKFWNKEKEVFFIKEFVYYNNYVYIRDSLFVQKKLLINDPSKDLQKLRDTLLLWSENNFPNHLLNSKAVIIDYKFYNYDKTEVNEYYKESGGFFSESSFGDKNNRVYVIIRWRVYRDERKIWRFITLYDENIITLSKKEYNY